MKKGSGRKKWLAVLGIGLLCGSVLSVAFLNSSSLIANESRQESATISSRSSEYEAALEEYNQAKEKYEEAKQAYETSKEEYQSLYEDYVTQKEMLDDLKKQADELLPDYQAACSAFEEAKQDYLTRLSFYEESGQKDLQEYQELLAEYRQLESEFLDLKEQYDVLQIKIGPIESAFQTAKDAYDDIAEKKSELEQGYQTVLELYEKASLKLEEVENGIEIGKEAYETAIEAQKKAQTAVNRLNTDLTQMNQIMMKFPNDRLFDADYDSRLSDWQAEYEAQKAKVEASKTAAFEVIGEYQAANDAYNASGIAPEEKLDIVFGPSDFETKYDEYLSQLVETMISNNTKVEEFIKIKEARDELLEEYKEYETTQTTAVSEFKDLSALLGCLAPQFPQYYNPSLLGAAFDEEYMEQKPTMENLTVLAAAYEKLVGELQPKINETIATPIESIEMYVTRQRTFAEKLNSFNELTGNNIEFSVRTISAPLNSLKNIQSNMQDAVEYNVGIYYGLAHTPDIDDFDSIAELYENNNAKLANDKWTIVSSTNIPEIPNSFTLTSPQFLTLELYEIEEPKIDSPTELSAEPEPLVLPDIDEPLPYPNVEPPTFGLPQPIPPKITMPMTGGMGVGGFTVTGASLIGLTHLFQERRKKIKKSKS